MTDITEFERALREGPATPEMTELVDGFREIFYDYSYMFHHWEWGWRLYIFLNAEGFVMLSFEDGFPHNTWITDLLVRHDCRKIGMGTELMNICEQTAALLGCERISLWADAESWVCGWYQGRGFRETGKDDEGRFIHYTKTL